MGTGQLSKFLGFATFVPSYSDTVDARNALATGQRIRRLLFAEASEERWEEGEGTFHGPGFVEAGQ